MFCAYGCNSHYSGCDFLIHDTAVDIVLDNIIFDPVFVSSLYCLMKFSKECMALAPVPGILQMEESSRCPDELQRLFSIVDPKVQLLYICCAN